MPLDFVHGFGATVISLLRLKDAGRRREAVRRLNAATDAELLARGLTRSGEVNRIFG